MKKNLFILLILFTNQIYSQQESKFGQSIPVNETFKVFLVFAESIPASNFTQTSSVPGYGKAPLPNDAYTYFDPTFTPNVEPTAFLSKYFYQASFGQYVVLADYLDHVVQVPPPSNIYDAQYPLIFNYIDQLFLQGQLQNKMENNSSLSDFDQYSITTIGAYQGIMKPVISNDKIDAIIILWKNHTAFPNGGFALQPIGYNLPIGPFTSGVENAAGFKYYNGTNEGGIAIISEFFHAMYGNNHWHSGGNGGNHTFPFYTSPWGITTQGGVHGVSIAVNGWDRFHLGYYGWQDVTQVIPKTNLISALDPTGNELNTDFTIQSSIGNGYFVLRDHVKYGDAIRIKLPHVQDDSDHLTAKNQYLWIENHQKQTDFDKGIYEQLSCTDDLNQGLWIFMQVGKDQTSGSNIYSSSFSHPNGLGSWIYPLYAGGNYDFTYESPQIGPNLNCVWENKTIAINYDNPGVTSNPLSGFSKIYNAYNYLQDDVINFSTDIYQPGFSEIINGTLEYNAHYWGDDELAWSLSTQKKLSLSSNPTPSAVLTLVSSNNVKDPPSISSVNQHTFPYENRNIWLNGISVEIIEENFQPLQFGAGAIKVKIRFDEYDVEGNVRWCGPIKVSPNDFDPTPGDFSDNYYALNVMSNSTVTLDRGRSYNRIWAVDQVPVTNENRFSEPTVMTVLPGAYMHMENNSKVIVDGESVLKVQSGGRLEIHQDGEMIVKKGSKLILEAGAQLSLHDNAIVKIEQGGFLEYDNSSIILSGNNSVIEFEGTLQLAANSEFTFVGDGFVKFSQQGWINPATNPSNIVAGAGSKIKLVGNNLNDKVLEVTQESMYAFLPLSKFTIQNGTALLGPDSRICADGDAEFSVAKISSVSGSQNAHRGVHLYGQPNVLINNSTFEYGKYGIFSILTYGGSPLTISNSFFKNNDVGLYAIDKGLTLNNCDFVGNNVGWVAESFTFPSRVSSSYFSNDEIGISYTSTGTSGLFAKRTDVTDHSFDGIEYDGPSMLNYFCGSITNNGLPNQRYGVYLANNAILNNSIQVAPFGGKTNFSGNYNALFADCANNWYLVGGRNNFTSVDKIALGEFNLPCNSPINGLNNQWNPTVSPLTGAEFSLGFCSNCPPNNILAVNDNNPRALFPCSLIWTPTPSEIQMLKQANPLVHSPGAEKITTVSFNNVKLNKAVEEALAFTKFGLDSALTGNENDLMAVQLFSEILMYTYNQGNKFDNAVSEEEGWLLELSNAKMKEALANAINNGETPASLSSPYVNMTISALDTIYNREIRKGNIEKAFYALVDKASVFTLVNERDEALRILDMQVPCLTLEITQLNFLKKIRSTIYTENQVYKGLLSKENFSGYWEQVKQNSFQIPDALPVINVPDDSLFAQVFFVDDTISFSSPVQTNSVTWDFGDCTTGNGTTTNHVYTTPGVYSVSVTTTGDCNSNSSAYSITVLPKYIISPSHSLIAKSCDDVNFLITKNGNFNGTINSCSSATYSEIDTSKVRIKFIWDSDKPTLTDFEEIFSYSELINNDDTSVNFKLLAGDTSIMKIQVVVQYFDGSEWINTIYNQNASDTMISIPIFQAEISMPKDFCPLDTIQFVSQVVGGTEPLKYKWTFSSGDTDTIPSPFTSFVNSGTNTVGLVVTDSVGCKASILFPQGTSHVHFDLINDSIQDEHEFTEFDFEVANCPTIFGVLKPSDPCNPLSFEKVKLQLQDHTGVNHLSAYVDRFGSFLFSATAVNNLDTNLNYTVVITEPKEYYILNPAKGTISQLIAGSPYNLTVAASQMKEVVNKSTTAFHTSYSLYVQDAGGNSYIVTSSSVNGTSDYSVSKYSPTSSLLWSSLVDNNNSLDSATSIAIDTNANLYITGYSWNGTDYDYFTVKLDSAGNYIWSSIYQDSLQTNDKADHICVLPDGGICVSGKNIYTNDIFYSNLKYKECDAAPVMRNGNIQNSSESAHQQESTVSAEKVRVYPNPNKTGTLHIDGNFQGNYSFELYDLSGRIIQKNKVISEGTIVQLNVFSDGIYFYLIRNNDTGSIFGKDKLIIQK